MDSFEDKVTAEDLARAKEQLTIGFELPNDPEQLNESYNELFEGIDSATLEEFKRVFESMPEDVKTEMQKGNIEPVTAYATGVLKWGKKKVAQLVVGILITVAAAPTFGADKNAQSVIPEGGIGAMMEIPKGGVGEQITFKRLSGSDQMDQDIVAYKKIQKNFRGADIAQDDAVEDDNGNVRATGRIVMGDHRS